MDDEHDGLINDERTIVDEGHTMQIAVLTPSTAHRRAGRPVPRVPVRGVKAIRNHLVHGDELFEAVRFLGEALDIPALRCPEANDAPTAKYPVVLARAA